MCQGKKVPPFPALLCLLSEHPLALLILQGEELPVVVNQKILGKYQEEFLLQTNQTKVDSFLNKLGFINTLMPIVSPSLR